MLRPKVIKWCYDSCVRYYEEFQHMENCSPGYYNPNCVYGTDVLDTVPQAGKDDITFSEREVVINLLNARFKWPIPLKHPKAYYLDCELAENQMGDINKTAVDQLISDIQREIREFQAESIGEEKYIILKLERVIKNLKFNWKQHVLFQKGLEDIENEQPV